MVGERVLFSSLASYFSALNSDLSRPHPRIDAIENKIAEAEVVIRSANSDVGVNLMGSMR
jgi:hypothetical protein